MVNCIAFGNNICGNLDAAGPSIIGSPKEIAIEGDVIFHSWCCTIIKHGGRCVIRGSVALSEIDLVPKAKRVIGFDRPVGFILQDCTIVDTHGKGHGQGSTKWFDAVVTGLGAAFAVNDNGVYHFELVRDLVDGETEGIKLDHPLLTKGNLNNVKLYATESRAFIAISTRHLIEIVDLRSIPGGGQGKELRLVEEVEGVGIKAFIVGSGNRAGVITEAEDAWLLPTRGDPELLELAISDGDRGHENENGNGNGDGDGDGDDEDVRLLGIGADFEVVVTNRAVYGRGSSECQDLTCPSIAKILWRSELITIYSTRQVWSTRPAGHPGIDRLHPYWVDIRRHDHTYTYG
ncbi:hypothetical protein IAU59_001931 [Kwoniella sp. CBS 9459]